MLVWTGDLGNENFGRGNFVSKHFNQWSAILIDEGSYTERASEPLLLMTLTLLSNYEVCTACINIVNL